MVIMHC